jgi:hypothetical protein
MIKRICMAAILTGTLACDGAGAPDASPADRPPAVAGASFKATLSGAAEQKLDGTGALAGAKYGRYHIHMASDGGRAGGPPVVVIAFGRTDTSTPAPGTYALGAREGFDGTVEIDGTPERDFVISGGELVITKASGDVLTGRFTLTASELTEEYTATPPEIRVEGSFQTRPAN